MNNYSIILIITLLVSTRPGLTQEVLQEYVQLGIENNQQLLQEALIVEDQKLALDQANGMYMPNLSFQGSYTLAGGGRAINFPVGDLLNPVYETLNQMTGSDQFPMIDNVNEQFLPNDFHETKLRLIQPLINTDIYYNKRINQDLIRAAEARRAAYENELIKEIKIAYFNYLQASEAIKIYDSNERPLKRLVKFNTSRFNEDQVTKDEVYRSEFELEQLKSDQASAISRLETAQAYFNFLLNRSYDTEILVDSTLQTAEAIQQISLEQAYQNRFELRQINAAQEAQLNAYKMASASRALPQINAVGDLGYQGFGYTFDSDQDFWLLNFNMQWNIFSGFQKKQQQQRAKVQLARLDSQEEQLRSQIAIEIVRARSRYEASISKLTARNKALSAAERTFEITTSRYKEGQALLIEFLDAQSSHITAQLDHSISKYEVLARKAELDRALAY